MEDSFFDNTQMLYEKDRRWRRKWGIRITLLLVALILIIVNCMVGCELVKEILDEIPEGTIEDVLPPGIKGTYTFDGDWKGWQDIWEVESKSGRTVVFDGRDGYIAYLAEEGQKWTDYNVDAELEVTGEFDNFGIAVRVEHQGRMVGGRYGSTPALDFVNINLCRVGNTVTGGAGDRVIVHGPTKEPYWFVDSEGRVDANYHICNPDHLFKPPTVHTIPQRVRIYVECRGNRIRAQVNGSLVADIIDDNIPSKGGIALIGARRGGTCTVRIHQLKVETSGLANLPERGW